MKKVILLAFLLSSSCFLFPGDDSITGSSTAPPVQDNEDGTVTYNPIDTNLSGDLVYDEYNPSINNTNSGTEPVVCQQDVIIFKEGPHEVKPSIQFVFKTFDGVYSDTAFYQGRLKYEHVFVKEVKVTSLAGDDLNFVAWAKAYMVAPSVTNQAVLVGWGGPFDRGDYVITLGINGGLDLSDFIYADDLSIEWQLRGKSPSTKTWIEVEATFIGLYWCE